MGRGVKVKFGMKFDSPPRGAPAPLKGGSLPPYSPLSCATPFVGREDSARLEETRIEGSSISLDPVATRVFGHDANHSGEGSAL